MNSLLWYVIFRADDTCITSYLHKVDEQYFDKSFKYLLKIPKERMDNIWEGVGPVLKHLC